jgi:hypothetical protein
MATVNTLKCKHPKNEVKMHFTYLWQCLADSNSLSKDLLNFFFFQVHNYSSTLPNSLIGYLPVFFLEYRINILIDTTYYKNYYERKTNMKGGGVAASPIVKCSLEIGGGNVAISTQSTLQANACSRCQVLGTRPPDLLASSCTCYLSFPSTPVVIPLLCWLLSSCSLLGPRPLH